MLYRIGGFSASSHHENRPMLVQAPGLQSLNPEPAAGSKQHSLTPKPLLRIQAVRMSDSWRQLLFVGRGPVSARGRDRNSRPCPQQTDLWCEVKCTAPCTYIYIYYNHVSSRCAFGRTGRRRVASGPQQGLAATSEPFVDIADQ